MIRYLDSAKPGNQQVNDVAKEDQSFDPEAMDWSEGEGHSSGPIDWQIGDGSDDWDDFNDVDEVTAKRKKKSLPSETTAEEMMSMVSNGNSLVFSMTGALAQDSLFNYEVDETSHSQVILDLAVLNVSKEFKKFVDPVTGFHPSEGIVSIALFGVFF